MPVPSDCTVRIESALRTCGACGESDLQPRGHADYYTADGPISSELVRSAGCGTWFRILDPSRPELSTHFAVASYTDPRNEARLRAGREEFFRYLLRLCGSALSDSAEPRRLLDIGCAYGHMLDVFGRAGYQTAGVEIVDHLRESLRGRGFSVFSSLAEVPREQRFHVVAAVDSLYCLDDPLASLLQIHDYLREDGILLLRVTNRTPVLDMLYRLRRPITGSALGDSKFAFSAAGIRQLCVRAGFRVEREVLWERGKRIDGTAKWLYYQLGPLISRIVGRTLSPGIILLCRRA